MKLDIEGANIEAGGEEKLNQALADLAKDPHAPREVSVKFTLHVHNEYPKHVTVGEDKDGNAITKIVTNEDEEKAVLASLAKAEPAPVSTAVAAPVLVAPATQS